MLRWLLQNKEWLFSGMGVVIALATLSLLRWLWTKRYRAESQRHAAVATASREIAAVDRPRDIGTPEPSYSTPGAVLPAGVGRQPDLAPSPTLLDKDAGRVFLKEALPAIAVKARRRHRAAALFLVDVDELSLINKIYGTLVGDDVLKIIGQIVYQAGSQYCGRCGDDTFYAVSIGNSVAADQLLDRIRLGLHDQSWGKLANNLRVTCSIGFAKLGRKQAIGDWVVRVSVALKTVKSRGPRQAVEPREYLAANRAVEGPEYLAANDSRELRHYFS